MRRRIAATALPVVCAALLCLVNVEGFTLPMKFTVGVVFVTVAWWAFEVMPMPVVALVPLVAISLSGVLPPAKILSYYLHPLIFMLIGVFLLGSAALRSGLATRTAYYLMTRKWVDGKTRRIGLAFMIASAMVSLFVSNTATVAVFLPIVRGVANAFAASLVKSPDSGDSEITLSTLRFPGYLVACVLLGAQSTGFALMVGSPVSLAANSAFENTMGYGIGIYRWSLMGVPLSLAVLATYWFVLNKVYPPDCEEFPSYSDIAAARERLGKLTGQEKVALLGLALVVFLWLVPPVLHQLGLNGNFIAYLDKVSYLYTVPLYVSMIFFIVPVDRKGKSLLDWNTAQKDIGWGIILLVAGALSFSSLFSDQTIGLGGFVRGTLKGVVKQGSFTTTLVLVIGSGLICLLLTSVVSSTGFISLYASLTVPVAASIGLNAEAFAVMLGALGNIDFILPCGGAPAATAFSSGVFTVPRMFKIMLPCAVAAATVVMVLCSILVLR